LILAALCTPSAAQADTTNDPKDAALTSVEGNDAAPPLQTMQTIFGSMKPPPRTYRLDLISSSGRSLRLYFLVDDAISGLWCTDVCDATSFFMVLQPRPPAK
jgi:hypothetical protein